MAIIVFYDKFAGSEFGRAQRAVRAKPWRVLLKSPAWKTSFWESF